MHFAARIAGLLLVVLGGCDSWLDNTGETPSAGPIGCEPSSVVADPSTLAAGVRTTLRLRGTCLKGATAGLDGCADVSVVESGSDLLLTCTPLGAAGTHQGWVGLAGHAPSATFMVQFL
jgi:hypothetical protein